MRLKEMRDRVIEVEVDYLGEKVTVGMYPGRITQAATSAMMAHAWGDEDSNKELAEVIAYWDILDENDEQLPVTTDLLNVLPTAFVTAIPGALAEKLREQGNS